MTAPPSAQRVSDEGDFTDPMWGVRRHQAGLADAFGPPGSPDSWVERVAALEAENTRLRAALAAIAAEPCAWSGGAAGLSCLAEGVACRAVPVRRRR